MSSQDHRYETAVEAHADARPQAEDLVIARLSGRHGVSVVPRPAQITFASYADALARATAFARWQRVDVWAEDDNRFTLLERHRHTVKHT